MDFGAGREGTSGEGDGSEFLNESGEGMEEEQPHESETNDDCEDFSQETRRALTRSGEIYICEASIHESVDDNALSGIYINKCFFF
jgi:hypothetical protein